MIVEQRTGPNLQRWDLDTQIYQMWVGEELREARAFTDAELRWLLTYQRQAVRADRIANNERLLRLAYSSNLEYIDLIETDSPTAADHALQILRLTRQIQAIIRLVAIKTLAEENDVEPLPDVPPPVTGAPTGAPL